MIPAQDDIGCDPAWRKTLEVVTLFEFSIFKELVRVSLVCMLL